MSKAQFWILNIVGGVCAVLLLGNLMLGYSNQRTGQALNETQSQLNRTQQVENTAKNLIVRIAQAGQTEPALRNLLANHNLKIDLGDTKDKPTP